MIESSIAGPLSYSSQSSRDLWQVLVDEDKAEPVITTCSIGDDSTLQDLLSQPHWTDALFQQQHTIHAEVRPKLDQPEREVFARSMLNIERALIIAGTNGHAAVVTTLLSFASQHGHDASSIITRPVISEPIRKGHAGVLEAFATAWPRVISFDLIRGALPLYEAVRQKQLEVASTSLKLGAGPLHPVRNKVLGSYRSSLMSFAAMYDGPQMIELLLSRDVPIKGTAALHTAAAHGQFETARLLLENGADVNEKLPGGRTPMHFAAWRLRSEAMEFLKCHGADADAKDDQGGTPADTFEQYKREQQAREGRQG